MRVVPPPAASSWLKSVTVLLATALPVLAQQAPNELVIHLWVDPVYGDDGAVNSFFNPDGVGPECPPATLAGPHSVRENGTSGPPLLNAPHPFKTITAAIAYVNRLAPSGGGPPLPHTDVTTGLTWSYCIVHLLPGWYGRSNPSIVNLSIEPTKRNHLDNAHLPNGETFPLHLPPRVSLQGTSALNTIFDLGQVGTAIEFGKTINGTPINGIGTFIDKVTFYACGGYQEQRQSGSAVPQPNARSCCAVLIDGDVPSRPTISNCFFVKNILGVCVNASAELDTSHHGTTIVNCTFAWNMIGLWNGQIDAGSNSVGVSQLNLLNNIFDMSEPLDPQATKLQPCAFGGPGVPRSWPNWAFTAAGTGTGVRSAFEGIIQADLRARTAGTTGAFRDHNAYELGSTLTPPTTLVPAFNLQPTITFIATDLPITTPRAGSAPAPTNNIAAITGWPNQLAPTPPFTPRGILYVCDLICVGRSTALANPAFPPVTGSPGFDGSMLDFRLSPATAPAGLLPQAPTAFNALIDAGFAGPFPIEFENGQTMANPPGYLPLNPQSQGAWSRHCWESDCEGYGNPRIYDHPFNGSLISSDPTDTPAPIDIGADEAAELTIAGYRFGTTSFMVLDTSAGSHPDNPNPLPFLNAWLWYLGPPTALPNPLTQFTVSQPNFRYLESFNNGQSGHSYPAAYAPSGSTLRTVTWHSGEFATTGAPIRRPWYAIRNQDPLLLPLPRTQPLPVMPPAVTPPSSPDPLRFLQALIDLGQAYRATAADFTPSLLPDIHPWWGHQPSAMTTPPFVFMMYAMSPSFSLWQNETFCNNYIYNASLFTSFRNGTLYADPSASDITPPGAGLGGNGFAWLDASFLTPTDVPLYAQFENWTSTPMTIADFDGFCRGGTGTSFTTRSVLLPPTRVGVTNDTELAALRFTLEWHSGQVLWDLSATGLGRQRNSQSFLVLVDGPIPQ